MSFKDNFTREEKHDDLEFDYSAFWTYATTFLIVFLVPVLMKLKNIIFYQPAILDKHTYVNCECLKCNEKMKKYCDKKKKEKFNFTFYLFLFIAAVLIFSINSCYDEVIKNDGKLKSFNPREILEVSEDATEKEIKKAYRRLSVIWHPDRNKSPEAKAKFIMLTKAYEVLTDPDALIESKKNMKLSIALPPFVYEKKNHMPILVLFLTFLLFVLPIGIYYWYTTTQQFDENGVRVDNQRIFYEYLNENVLLRQMPFIVGAAVEFSNLKLRSEQSSALDLLNRTFKDKFPKHKEISYNNKKAILLIYACLDEKGIPDILKDDSDYVMSKVPDLVNNMYKLTVEWTIMYYQYGHLNNEKFRIKNLGPNCLKTIIEFSQSVHQQIGSNSVPFVQLPHITLDNHKALLK